MPNALLSDFRKQFPNDPRTDEELNYAFADELGPERVASIPDLSNDLRQLRLQLARDNRSIPSELWRGASSGIDTTQAKLYDTAALLGRMSGLKGLEDFGTEGYRRNLQEAADESPTIENVRDINLREHPFGDPVRYGLGLVGSQAPQMGLTLGGAAAGALVGGPVGAAIGSRMGMAGEALAAAGALGSTIGSHVGGGLAGFTQMQNFGELRDTPGVDQSAVVPTALAVGGIGAALESLVPAGVVDTLLKGAPAPVKNRFISSVVSKLPTGTQKFMARALVNAPKEAVSEGLTEVAQELTTIAGEAYANRFNPDYHLTSEDVQNRLINNGFAGFVLGGTAGGVESLHAHPLVSPKELERYNALTGGGELPPKTYPARQGLPDTGADLEAFRNIMAQQRPPAPWERFVPPGPRPLPYTPATPATPAAPAIPPTAPVTPAPVTPAPSEAVGSPIPILQPQALLDALALGAVNGDASRIDDGRRFALRAEYTAEGLARDLGTDTRAAPMLRKAGVMVLNEQGNYVLNPDFFKQQIDALTIKPVEAAFTLDATPPPPPIAPAPVAPAPAPDVSPTAIQRQLVLNPLPPYIPPGPRPVTAVPSSPATPPRSPYGPAPYTAPGERPLPYTPATEPTLPGQPARPDNAPGAGAKQKGVEPNATQERIIERQQQHPPTQEGGIPTETGRSNLAEEGGQVEEVTPKEYRPLDIEQVDFEHGGTVGEVSRRGTGKAEVVEGKVKKRGEARAEAVQPAFVDLRELLPDPEARLKYSPALGDLLTSSSGTQKEKTQTPKITFFRNTETGEVVGLPTYKRSMKNADGKVESTHYVGAQEGEKAGKKLRTFMGDGQWEPVASVKMKDVAEKGINYTYPNSEAFNRDLAEPAKERLGQQQRDTAAYEEALLGGEPSTGTVGGPLATEEHLFTDALVEALPKEKHGNTTRFKRDLKVDNVEESLITLSEDPELRPELYRHFKDIIGRLMSEGGDNWDEFQEMSVPEKQKVLLGQFAREIYEAIRKSGSSMDSVPKLLGGVQENVGGDIRGARPGAAPGGHTTRYSLRAVPAWTTGQGKVRNPEVQKRLAQLTERLAELGINVNTIQDLYEWGHYYRGKDRIITLALHDAENPTVDNLRVTLHEAAHDVFHNLPKQVQAILTAAVDSMSDEQLGVDASLDPRTREDNPTGMPRGEFLEERLVSALAEHGLANAPARHIAARLFRAIKELYFRAAMAMQRAFGRQPSAALAFKFARNRLAGMESGMSLSEFLVPPMVNQSEEEAISRNSLRYEGVGGRVHPTTIPETKIAALNEQLDLEKNATIPFLRNMTIPGADTDAEKLAWFRKRNRFENLDELKASVLRNAIDPETGVTLPVNKDQRINDFKDERNKTLAAQAHYITSQDQYEKLFNNVDKLLVRLEELGKEKKETGEELRQKKDDFANIEGLTRLITKETRRSVRSLFKDISGTSMRMGVVLQELSQLDDTPDIIKVYEPVFRKLFGKGQMGEMGEKITDYLDRMANDPLLDINNSEPMFWDKGIRDIRADLTYAYNNGHTEYAPLIQNTKESRALLAATMAYAKQNKTMMVALALRRTKDMELLGRIKGQLNDLFTEGKEETLSFEKMGKMSALETRARDAYNEEKHKAQSIAAEEAETKAQYDAARGLVDIYRRQYQKAAGPNGVHAPAVLRHGFEYGVPNVANMADVKGLGEGMELKVLKLDHAGGDHAGANVTSQKEMDEDADKMKEFLDHREATGNLDAQYYKTLAERNELLAHGLDTTRKSTDYLVTELLASNLGKQIAAFGTPAARMIQRMLNMFAGGIGKSVDDEATTIEAPVAVAQYKAAKAAGVSQAYFDKNFYPLAAGFLEKQRDIAEQYPNNPAAQYDAAFKKFIEHVKQNTEYVKVLTGKWDKFLPAMRRFMEGAWKVSQWRSERAHNEGLGVIDPKLRVETDKGKFVTGERNPQNVGLMTFPKHLNETFDRTFTHMLAANWQAFNPAGDEETQTPSIREIYNTMGPEQVEQDTAQYTSDPFIQKDFLEATALDNPDTPFPAPMLPDGVTQPEASPALIARAWKTSGGSLLKFAENSYDLHGGKTDRGQYVQDIFETFKHGWDEMLQAQTQRNPAAMGGKAATTLENMVPNYMVNARQEKFFPSRWFTYENFTGRGNRRVNLKIAAEKAFGPNARRLIPAWALLEKDVGEDLSKLAQAKATVSQSYPGEDQKEFERLMEKEVGGKDELKRLRRTQELSPLLKNAKQDLIKYVQGKNNEVKSLSVLKTMINTLSHAMVETPPAALGQTVEAFAPVLQEPSPANAKWALKNFVDIAKIGVQSAAKAVGLEFQKGNWRDQKFRELGLGDPEPAISLMDKLKLINRPDPSREPGIRGAVSSGIGRAFHSTGAVLGTSINRTGQNPDVAIKPILPFGTLNNVIHGANTKNLWDQADKDVVNGVKNIHKLKPGMTPEQAADALGLKGGVTGERNRFIRLWNTGAEWGMRYYQMVKEAERNIKNGKQPLSDQTLRRLQGMGIQMLSSQSDLSTMPPSLLNNRLFEAAAPLLTFSIRRALQVAGLRLDAQGKNSLSALARGLTGLALLGGGGIAVSMLVDLYNEELLKKKRNIRRLSLSHGAGNLAMGLLEHNVRVGTLGGLGDILNTAVNVGTGGGDNRGVSFDGRVVFASAITNLLKVMSAMSNEHTLTDYATIVRPTMQALGGNGALQYMQLINQISGDMFKGEAEATARTNVNNWLRVIGRELGIEVRKMDGGFATPTPLTPLVTKMQLASYGNDPVEFRQAYSEALKVAREEGHSDPADYVQRAFGARNPLRSIFAAPPSDLDVRRMMNALPEDGRREVQAAVNSFNRYAATIGARPFEGKPARSAGAGARGGGLFGGGLDLNGARERAALFR